MGKPLYLFALQKKRPGNAFQHELLQNCTEKQIMPSKTTINGLFDDI